MIGWPYPIDPHWLTMAHRTKRHSPSRLVTAQDRDAQLLRSFRSAHQQNPEKSLAAVSLACRRVAQGWSWKPTFRWFRTIWVVSKCKRSLPPYWRKVLAMADGGYPWTVAFRHRDDQNQIAWATGSVDTESTLQTAQLSWAQKCIKEFIQCVFQPFVFVTSPGTWFHQNSWLL